MVEALAFGLCCAGLTALAASMQSHAREVFGGGRMQRMVCRVSGWVLLAASVGASCAAWGAAVGLVAWFGVATVAVLTVAIGLTTVRRRSASRISPQKERRVEV